MARNKHKIYELSIEKLTDDGRGLAKLGEKDIFVSGALAKEKITAKRTLSRKNYEYAQVVEILEPSEERIKPECKVYELCGGCSFQHISSDRQITLKQNWLASLFEAKNISPLTWLEPLRDKPWLYRRKARLGVKYVYKKEKVLVGFREKKSSFITETDNCKIMHPIVGENLAILAQCINKLSIKQHIPQIEVAIGEESSILILRHLLELSSQDRDILTSYEKLLSIKWYTQSAGLDSIKPLNEEVKLNYLLPKHNIKIDFLASDFTQVNFEINRQMVDLAISLLEINIKDRVIDFFCGLGNFSLAIARYANSVVGIELDKNLLDRARQNAINNAIDNVCFYESDLSKNVNLDFLEDKAYNKVLIDPARTGAAELIELLPTLKVERIVYVSCNPKTLAKDAYKLKQLGYELIKAGVMDMFAQTLHIESIALFVKK